MPDEVRPVEPTGPIWLEQPWRAFNELQSERPFYTTGHATPMGGMSISAQPGPIPWSKRQEWCDRNGCDEEQREFVLGCVEALDAAFLAHWRSRQGMAGVPEQSMDDKIARWDAAD